MGCRRQRSYTLQLFSSQSLLSAFQTISKECECCGRTLAELGVAVQEFGEQNPLLCKQLGDAVAKLMEVQRHTAQQIQDRSNRLKKVSKKTIQKS